MDNLDILYQKYNVLVDAGDNISQHEEDFKFILGAVKGSANEKRLASQFISKFFSKFPQHANDSLDALLDLCEDEDVNIRKQAIRDLPTICKDSTEYVPKITDILTQLLVTEDISELQVVNASLVAVYRLHPKGFLSGVFSQIENGDEVTREKAVNFLAQKLRVLPDQAWTRELEEFLIQQIRTAMTDCTKDEFVVFMTILSGLKVTKLVSGQQTLLDIITEQVDLTSTESIDPDSLDKLLMCVKYAASHFSPFVTSNAYVNYFCLALLPNLDTLALETPGIDLEILQYLAEIVASVQPTNQVTPLNLTLCQEQIFARLLLLLPLPPTDGMPEDEPSLQLTHVESILYAFHQISKHNSDFITANEERLKDLKLRLQFLARGVQSYIKKLRESLSTASKGTGDANDSEENKLKLIALKTTTNINSLIRDLFHTPPSFKTTLHLSWKPVTKSVGGQKTSVEPITTVVSPSSRTGKRKAIEAPSSDPQTKKERKFYAPPTGKFSASSRPFRGGGGFRGRGSSFAPRGGRGGRGRGFYSKRFN